MASLFHIKDTIRLLYPVRVVALGLAVAQAIGTVLVYLSNRALAAKIAAIQATGYGPLPGVDIVPSLSSFEAAFAGGAFFTLSTGAGVVLLTFGATLLILPLPSLYRVFTSKVLKTGWRILALALFLTTALAAAVPAVGWLVLLIRANTRGFCPGLSAFLLLLPPVVVWATLKWSPRKAGQARLPWRNPVHFVLIAILLVIWSSQVNADMFINFKDNLLLTSRPGAGIVEFYYRYTLYPAEVFKRPCDKQLKTCVLAGDDDRIAVDRLERVLRAHDYFVVPEDWGNADLKLVLQGDRLILGHKKEAVLIVDRQRFMAATDEILEDFCQETDHNAVFRRFTIVALAGVAPLVLYLTSYAVFCLLPGALISIRVSSFLVPLLCFMLWAGVMAALDMPAQAETNKNRAAAAIRDGSRKERIAALRYVYKKQLDIVDFEGYHDLLKTPDVAQRYWLVKNLGNSNGPGTAAAVAQFLASDSAYIVCKAIAATAVRAAKQGTMDRQQYQWMLLEKIRESDNWYVQFYAYKAARSLGWIPEKSG